MLALQSSKPIVNSIWRANATKAPTVTTHTIVPYRNEGNCANSISKDSAVSEFFFRWKNDQFRFLNYSQYGIFTGKGEDCLFMHGEFPCKFFHTNTECYAGEKCRFSHAPLTEDKREILRNYLDSGTLPDDPKPFRTHYSSDWSNSNKNEDYNDFDSSEIDSSFNYETERKFCPPILEAILD